MPPRKLFLVKSGALFICRGRNYITSTSRSLLKYKCKQDLKQPLTPPQCKIIVAWCILYHRLAIKTRRRSTITIFRDIRLCRFCSSNVVEKWHTFSWSVPLYSCVNDNFQSLLENTVARRPKSFFQLDHQLDTNLLPPSQTYCPTPGSRTISLGQRKYISGWLPHSRHSRGTTSLTTSSYAFSPISLSASRNLKPISFHWAWLVKISWRQYFEANNDYKVTNRYELAKVNAHNHILIVPFTC